MGVFGRPPWIPWRPWRPWRPWIMVGGARLSGEKNCPVGMFRKSANPSPPEVAGARTVGVSGVIGVTPLEAVVPKNCVPNIPGDIGMPWAGNTNFVMSLSWFKCCCCCCCCCAWAWAWACCWAACVSKRM